MSPLTRLTLRRDRAALIGWTLGVGALAAYSVGALSTVYDTVEERRAFASAFTSPVAAMFTGPGYGLDAPDPSLGAIVASEVLGYLALVAVLAGLLMSVARTRGDEETGPGELLRAAPVGRGRTSLAALTSVLVTGVAMAAVVTGLTVAAGLAATDALAVGAGLLACAATGAGAGLVLGALAASARSARGLGVLLVIAWYQLRGLGDSSADLRWMSWTTPIGLVQQARPWVDLRWTPIALVVAAAVVLVAAGCALQARRELGAGLVTLPGAWRAHRGGPAGAVGIALRTSAAARGWWVVGGIVFAAVYGVFTSQVETSFAKMFADNPALQAFVGQSLNVQTYLRLIVTYGGLVLAAAAVALAGSAVAEEDSGRAAAVLTGPVARGRWLAGRVGVMVVGLTVMAAAIGVTLSVAALGPLMADDAPAAAHPATLAAGVLAGCLATVPAALLLGALTLAVYALAPRAARAVGWSLLAASFCVLMLGAVLKAPQWVLNLSPLTHLPELPTAVAGRDAAGAGTWEVVLGPARAWIGPGVCLALAAGLVVVAWAALRRRDMAG